MDSLLAVIIIGILIVCTLVGVLLAVGVVVTEVDASSRRRKETNEEISYWYRRRYEKKKFSIKEIQSKYKSASILHAVTLLFTLYFMVYSFIAKQYQYLLLLILLLPLARLLKCKKNALADLYKTDPENIAALMKNISINGDSICIKGKRRTIYIDPSNIKDESHDASIIMITKPKYDEESISNVLNNHSSFFVPKKIEKELGKLYKANVVFGSKPNEPFPSKGILVKTHSSYFKDQERNQFPSTDCLGFSFRIDGVIVYVAGETQLIDGVSCDILILPMTCTLQETKEIITICRPSEVILINAKNGYSIENLKQELNYTHFTLVKQKKR